MRKLFTILSGIVLFGMLFVGCKDEESYADKKEKERKVISAFLSRNPLILTTSEGLVLLNTPKIKPISQTVFEAKDCTTDVDANEYVLFANTGIYMQIVRKGSGEKLKHGETKRVLCRYWEWNILGDSLQTSDRVTYYLPSPEILDVSNNSGTITASFNVSGETDGAMYMAYGSTTVPAGWIVPLSYVNLGRQNEEGVALVRLIVPHSQGTADATSNVYPCFYEISYEAMRD
ncbi:MAG: DUF4827 domain-containing protein [Bacteroidaceae bacterium]|nr:DUF4827 domain-containing protein [Bacteroidaceae bacterium]